jgi:repressor LexA
MLNERARDIYSFIQRFRRERGSAPTIREIGDHFRISSTNGVRYYLDMLEREGYIQRNRKVSRGIGPMREARTDAGIPVLGRVAAGQPILAEENWDGSLTLQESFGDTSELFALRVRGDSMIDAGILEGDHVIVKRQPEARTGEIVVALLEDEATVKYYRPQRGRIELVAANAKYRPIVVEPGQNMQILGVVRVVVRTVG